METILIKGQVPLPIDREIRDRLESGHADSFLMIVPTAHARRKWQCECLQYAPNRAAAGLHIHTLEDLVRRFYGRLGSTRRQVSEGLQTVWMRQIIDGLELPFLKPHAEIPVPQGTVTRLTGAINQLKASGITPSQLQGDLVQSELVERGKLADLIAIYEAYERRLGDEWIDRAGLHHAVSSHLSSAGTVMRSIFPNVEMVIVRGFDVFSPPDLSMLTGIADLPQIGMGIRLDFDAQNESLFGHVKESYAQLLNCGFREINEKLVQETTDASFNFQAENRNRHFAQNLFRKDRWLEQSAEKLELTDQISLLGVSDRVQEVEQIAGLINQLVLDQPDLDLHRICVTCYDLSIYAPLMREIFPLYGIPHALDWGNALAHSPLVTSIFSLLDFIAGMASPRNRCKILRSPYFHFDQTIEDVMVQCQFNTQMTPDTIRTPIGQ
ncbi:MAG: hypothetical protein O7E52_11655 [Candidatus Poribacteria bacterium]|nr:hypothetical protein [Candidatus Poribacteria bacterium]